MVKLYKKLSMPSVHSKLLSSKAENTSQYIPQLISIQNLNTAERKIKDRESLRLKLEPIFKATANIKEIARKHLDKITAYKPEEQTIIYTLYDTILARELESHEKEELLEIIKSPLCFVGLKAPLELFSASITYPTQTSAPFERWLNTQVVNYMTTVVTKIVEDINEYVFFNAPDPQSVHQKEPVIKYLDEEYNLYSGAYPNDVYNGLSQLGKTFIKESIDRLNEASSMGGILNLCSWVEAIEEQLDHSDTVLCCGAYIFELSQKEGISSEFKAILEALTDEITNGEIKKDTYIYKSEDKYKPTRKLIELFLKNSLLEDEPKGRREGAKETKANEQAQQNPFCLRHSIKETFIRAAHGTEDEINCAIETDSRNWTIHEKVLFLHIVKSRFKDGVSFLHNLTAEQKKVFYIANETGVTPLHSAAFNGHVEVIKELLQGLSHEERKVYLHMATNERVTPLHCAAFNGHLEVIKELLQGLSHEERKDYLHMVNNNGYTPLHSAAKKGHVNVIKEILQGSSDEERKAYLYNANNRGFNPLYTALNNSKVEAASVLKEYGAQESLGMWFRQMFYFFIFSIALFLAKLKNTYVSCRFR